MSVDRDFKVGIEADASQAVQATKQVTDETERYEAALRKMAIKAWVNFTNTAGGVFKLPLYQ